MALSTKLTLKFDGDSVKRGLSSIRSGFSKLAASIAAGKSSLSGIAGPMTKIAALLGPAAIGAGFVKFASSASEAASSVESLTTQFKTLLGSQDAAVKRMKELSKFAAETPFDVGEISEASKQLQVAGGDILATGDGLRMVGDAAALAGQPISEVALHVGRLFSALSSGTSAGEATARLMELSLISGTAKRHFESLAAAQKRGETRTLSSADALSVLSQALVKSKGSMINLSSTTEGKLSNLKDSWNQLLVAFGTPLNDHLRPMLGQISGSLANLAAQMRAFGESTGRTLSAIWNSVGNGDFMPLIKNGFLAAASAAGEKLIAAFIFGGNAIGNQLRDLLRGTEIAGYKVKVGANVRNTWAGASEIARNTFNSEGYANAFSQTLDRNQSPVTSNSGERFRYAQPGERSVFSDAQGNKLISVMERVEQHLRPAF
ncbi:MAG: tape measure protein [Verrucomicrobiota bacterium]